MNNEHVRFLLYVLSPALVRVRPVAHNLTGRITSRLNLPIQLNLEVIVPLPINVNSTHIHRIESQDHRQQRQSHQSPVLYFPWPSVGQKELVLY